MFSVRSTYEKFEKKLRCLFLLSDEEPFYLLRKCEINLAFSSSSALESVLRSFVSDKPFHRISVDSTPNRRNKAAFPYFHVPSSVEEA